jgi:uncharacterized protein YdeI (YjbR/CyaY-like superfamily)
MPAQGVFKTGWQVCRAPGGRSTLSLSNKKNNNTMKQLYFKTSVEWKEWLKGNHDRETEVWLVFYKKYSSKPTIEYESAVQEALCVGWIDSIIKRLDETKYVRKFTPRKEDSKWSEINKKRAKSLISKQRMTDIGLAKIEQAKRNGQWYKSNQPNISLKIPLKFRQALDSNRLAKTYFEQLAPTYQKHYIAWINVAKREDTKVKRIKESIALLSQNKKLGLK